MGRVYKIANTGWMTLPTHYVVDDGLWVAEAFTSGDARHDFTLGSAEVKTIVLETSASGQRVLLVSSEPFGVVCTEGPGYGKYFRSARQINQGQLGQYVPIVNKIQFAREAKPGVVGSRDLRRSHVGWARVTDLVRASGLTLEETLLGFWAFVDFTYDPYAWSPVFKPTMDMHWSSERHQIHNQLPKPPIALTEDDLRRALDDAGVDWNVVWLRKGYANTVLRLLALGCKPEANSLQPA